MTTEEISQIKNHFQTMSVKARDGEPYSKEDWLLLGRYIGEMEKEIIELQNEKNDTR